MEQWKAKYVVFGVFGHHLRLLLNLLETKYGNLAKLDIPMVAVEGFNDMNKLQSKYSLQIAVRDVDPQWLKANWTEKTREQLNHVSFFYSL